MSPKDATPGKGQPPLAADLSHRTKRILHAVVKEYLQSGEAVGSRTVTRRHGIDLSPATVRNVMADLEEMGLLNQPHASAGRVPTGRGLRVFIDSLLKVRGLSPREKEAIRTMSGVGTLDVDGVIEQTSRTLSEFTHYAGIVLAPDPDQARLDHVEFVPLGGPRFLCILVTNDGRIENKLIEVPLAVAPEQLERIHNYVNALLAGLNLSEVRARVLEQLGQEKNRYDDMVAAALRMSEAALERSANVPIHVHGGANLIATNMNSGDDLVKMKELLKALEDKEIIVRLLDEAMTADRVKVFLGAESEFEPFGDTSVVAMPYGPGDKPIGAIAVIGPTRMNYGKVMSVVDFTAAMVSRLMSGE